MNKDIENLKKEFKEQDKNLNTKEEKKELKKQYNKIKKAIKDSNKLLNDKSFEKEMKKFDKIHKKYGGFLNRDN